MKRSLIVIAVLLMISTGLCASMNIAYVDTDKVMLESEDTQEAQQLFQSEQQNWQDEIAELDAEIRSLQEDLEKKKMILTDSGREEAETKIQEMITERDEKVSQIFGEGGQAMQKNAELLEPILTKLQGVIETISQEQNIDIVFDASMGGILYAVPTIDITDEVIERMNKLADETGEDN